MISWYKGAHIASVVNSDWRDTDTTGLVFQPKKKKLHVIFNRNLRIKHLV